MSSSTVLVHVFKTVFEPEIQVYTSQWGWPWGESRTNPSARKGVRWLSRILQGICDSTFIFSHKKEIECSHHSSLLGAVGNHLQNGQGSFSLKEFCECQIARLREFKNYFLKHFLKSRPPFRNPDSLFFGPSFFTGDNESQEQKVDWDGMELLCKQEPAADVINAVNAKVPRTCSFPS